MGITILGGVTSTTPTEGPWSTQIVSTGTTCLSSGVHQTDIPLFTQPLFSQPQPIPSFFNPRSFLLFFPNYRVEKGFKSSVCGWKSPDIGFIQVSPAFRVFTATPCIHGPCFQTGSVQFSQHGRVSLSKGLQSLAESATLPRTLPNFSQIPSA
jgi:hypothetical protein